MDRNGRTIFVADAHRDDGQRFVVHADEKLTAFVELERAIYEFAVDRLDSVSAAGARLCDAKDKALQGQ
jgi:c-di-GMP-binding flagellar brake protein YcgR